MAKAVVVSEKGMTYQDAVDLQRELAILLLKSRYLASSSNILDRLVHDLDFVVHFISPSSRRYPIATEKCKALIADLGLSNDPKVWRVSEAADLLAGETDHSLVLTRNKALDDAESSRFQYNQQYVGRVALSSLHRHATMALESIR